MIEKKSINWSYSVPARLTSLTNFRVPTISPILLITEWLHTSSRLTSCFSNKSYSLPNTSTVSSLNNTNPLLWSQYQNVMIAIIFKVNILNILNIIIVHHPQKYFHPRQIPEHLYYCQMFALTQKSVFLHFLDCDRYLSVTWSAMRYLWANKPLGNGRKLFLQIFSRERDFSF